MKTNIPSAVTAWVSAHKGSRKPKHIPGAFASYSVSKSSCCWGQPIGGIAVAGFRIAVCQPSPQRKGETAFFLYDYATA